MKIDEVAAARYAVALFQAAKKKRELKKVGDDIQDLRKLLIPSGLKQYLENPRYSFQRKKRVIDNLKTKFRSPITTGFLMVLLKKSRVSLIFGVIARFESLMDAEYDIVPAEVRLAGKPNKIFEEHLQRSLEKITNKKVKMIIRVVPDMLGGIFVKIQNHVLDATIKTRLQEIKKTLLECSLN